MGGQDAERWAGALAERLGTVLRPLLRVPERFVVLLDGRSGSGKSTLGAALAPALGAALVHVEDMYPGWDGLDAASRHLHDEVLSSRHPRYRGWDWDRDEPAGWTDVDPSASLVIEGVGALSRRNRALATCAVWLELDAEERRRRALARDGDGYAPHWERWARQEELFIARERPPELADIVVDVETGALSARAGG